MKVPTGQMSKQVENLIISLISISLKLLKKNVPVAAVWYQGGEVKHFGSTNLAKLLQSLDSASLRETMELDEQNLKSGDEPLLSSGEEEPCGKVMA